MGHKLNTIRAAALLVLPLALAACGAPADEGTAPDPADTPIPVEPDGGIGDGAGPPAAAANSDAIHPEMRGRWGLTPGDCTTDDAEGLLTVAPERLTFYESVGELGSIGTRTESSLRATYGFTGEGMTWTRDISLTLEDDGRTLVRREHGSEASPGAFIYTRCP